MQQKEIIVNTKKKPGRPPYKIKTPQLVECVNCMKTYDLNLRSLDQAIIDDTKFCSNCFQEILNQEENHYLDPIDKTIADFWSGKIRYGGGM